MIDPELLRRLARQLTDHLATVETAYQRCRDAADHIEMAGHAQPAQRRLRAALHDALDDWHGLRRLPHLLGRDIGFVVEARQRALGADSDDGRARHHIDDLIGSLAARHGRGTRRDVAELLHQLYRDDRPSGHPHQHQHAGPRTHHEGAESHHGGGPAHSVSGVRLGHAWGGTASIFRQFITPFLREHGLNAGSTKRGYDTVPGPGVSDHFTGSRHAYAVDYPTFRGEHAARALAHAMGHGSWRPNSYDSFTVTVDGQRFRVQILWGARIAHGDHVHVGVRRQ